MLDTAIIESLSHRSTHQDAARTSAPGPMVGWIQLRERGPLHRLFETEAGRFFYWSVIAARFIPIAKERLPEVVQL
jgi:hypothetical protein